jgi:hypothetical protein
MSPDISRNIYNNFDFTKYERRYTGWERIKAFAFHCYILTLGAIVQPSKSKKYIEVFDEFIKSKQKT